jgi:hypothetical protein
MSQDDKAPTKGFPWTAFFGFLGVVLVAYMSYINTKLQIDKPIEYTQTAEAKLSAQTMQFSLLSTETPQPSFTPSLTITLTQRDCPYRGKTEHDTIINLIQAEATAVNNKDLQIILEIFSPDAEFHDYQNNPSKKWEGPISRYRDDLFVHTNFNGAEHFDISPVEPGIDDGTAYYVSGSRGSYRGDGDQDWMPFNNPSLSSSPYGSDHWVLQKDGNGCWVIVRMEFNASHVKFP